MNEVRVLLHENQICERGTTQAVVDYARGLRHLGHNVTITYPTQSPANDPRQIELLSGEFELQAYTGIPELREVGRSFDAAYFIKAGTRDGKDAGQIRTVVHAVFQDYDPHGDHYAYVSRWLAQHMRREVTGFRGRRSEAHARGLEALAAGCSNALAFDAIPHACDMPAAATSLRYSLGIPDGAFVMLRYGGFETFDLDWVQRLVVEQLEANRHWYFVGVNTRPFTDHERARFVPPVYDRQEKADLLGSADVFVTARAEGESFGLSLVEALQVGTPVLAWSGGRDRNHVGMLRDIDGLYKGPRQLRRKLRLISDGASNQTETARMARGDEYRPIRVTPILEAALVGEARYFALDSQ